MARRAGIEPTRLDSDDVPALRRIHRVSARKYRTSELSRRSQVNHQLLYLQKDAKHVNKLCSMSAYSDILKTRNSCYQKNGLFVNSSVFRTA